MIRDAKGGPLTWLIERYVARKVRTAFRGVWARGVLPDAEGGLLVYANHSSFWDGFVIHQLAKRAGWDGYAMMEEENLARYPFHARIGAFSVRRGDRRAALVSVRYAADVLRRRKAAVFIFPEGELRPGQGPLGPLQRGVEVIARHARVRCLPVAIRYAFLEHEYPDVLLEVGAPHPPDELPRFVDELSRVYQRVCAARDTGGFTRLIEGRRSVQERWDSARGLGDETPALPAKTPAEKA
ncbi:MAG: lysophospholipid acyltransferase family protein [Myxococcota bacterium]